MGVQLGLWTWSVTVTSHNMLPALLIILLPTISTGFQTRHPYSYQYNVRDPQSRNNYQVTEEGGPEEGSGSYQVQLPDGRTQIVSYEVRAGEGYKAVVRYEGEAVYPDIDRDKTGHSLKRQSKQLNSQKRISDALFSEVYRDSSRDNTVRKQRKLPALTDQDLDLSPSQNVISGAEPFQTNFALKRYLPVRRKQENYIPISRRKLKKSPLIKKVRVPVTLLPKYVKKTKPEKVYEIPINIVENNFHINAEQITNSTQSTELKETEEHISATESPLNPAVETLTGKISEFEKLKEIEEIGNTVTDEYDEDYFEDYSIFPFGSRLTSVILNPSSGLEEEKEPEPASAEAAREADQEVPESPTVKPSERIDPVHPGSPQPLRFVQTENNTFVPEL